MSSDLIYNQPIVIDNGTGIIKADFAGEQDPRVVFGSCVGRPKHQRLMTSSLVGDAFVGKTVEEHRGLMKLSYPMEHGIVQDWDDMRRVWSHVFKQEPLNVPVEHHPILLTEAPLNPRRNRERAAEIFFEEFKVPALFFSPQALLSLYASGRTTGVVLDVGDGVSHVVPVYQGYALQHGIRRSDVAGRDVTRRLQLLLRKAGYAFHTSAEFEIVRDMKEQMCFVRMPMDAERESTDKYRLPDKSVVELDSERYEAPEVLFNPELVGLEYPGIHRCVSDAVRSADVDLRPKLCSDIVLAGGSTLFPGFGDRLLNEVHTLMSRETKLRIYAPPNRQLSTWIGGSILASLATFKSMWVRRADFAEEGGRALLHSKTL